MLFSILLLLVLVAVGLFAAYLLFMGVFYLVAFVVTAWQLRTGRITREQLAQKAAEHKRRKRKSGGNSDGGSYRSSVPLMDHDITW